jgi:polysaccharide pyruvyl transferase WcaK-like protein
MMVPDSINGWIHHVRRFTAAVNTRIHGTLMSIAAGVPAVCIWHDTRTRELSQRLRLPHISIRDFTTHRHNLSEVFANSGFDAEAFDEGRREIATTYASILRDAGLPASRHLQTFLSGTQLPKAA